MAQECESKEKDDSRMSNNSAIAKPAPRDKKVTQTIESIKEEGKKPGKFILMISRGPT
jgi:hypothetical protein